MKLVTYIRKYGVVALILKISLSKLNAIVISIFWGETQRQRKRKEVIALVKTYIVCEQYK